MKSFIIYDSVFGNTEKLAQAVGKAIGADVKRVTDVQAGQLAGLDWLIVASPTRAFRPTEGISKFLNSLPNGALQGIKVGAFDTRMDIQKVNNKFLTFMAKHMGYADAVIAKLLVKKGGQLVEPTGGFVVQESEGPLGEGELERAVKWGQSLIKP
jgi:flavodoxin I